MASTIQNALNRRKTRCLTEKASPEVLTEPNPDWYHNLKAHPDVQIEVGDETIDVRAEEITGPEHDRLYARQASLYPGFAEYQRQTKRIIPVIALTPAMSIGSRN
jgi:deazaflavin-dependent oxidoreductase (nitroreductase family)